MKPLGDGTKKSGRYTGLSIAQEFANAVCHFLRTHNLAKKHPNGGMELPITEDAWRDVLDLEFSPRSGQRLKKYCGYYNTAAHGHGYDLDERFDCGTGKRHSKDQNKGTPVEEINIALAVHPGSRPPYLKPMEVIEIIRQRLSAIPTERGRAAAAKLKAELRRTTARHKPVATRKAKPKTTVFRFADESALEGVLREVRMFARSRNRSIRNRKLEKAKGRCEACRRDFAKILGGKGVRVLLVHHDRRQLSAYDLKGEETREEDLAVVCANCHMLIHVDPKNPMSVKRLRQELRDGRGRSR